MLIIKFINQHKRSFISSIFLLVILIGLVLAHLAEQFEKKSIIIFDSLSRNGLIKCEKMEFNKFSLTLKLIKPKISVPVFNGILTYTIHKNLYIRHNFFQKKTIFWTDSNSEIIFEKDGIITPVLFLDQDSNKNAIEFYIKNNHFIPFGLVNKIGIEIDNLDAWFGKRPASMNKNEVLSNPQSQFLESLRTAIIIKADYLHYCISLNWEKNNNTKENNHYKLIEIHEDYSDKNISTQLNSNVNQRSQDNFSSFKGLITFKPSTSNAIDIKNKKSDHNHLLEKILNTPFNINRTGKTNSAEIETTFESKTQSTPHKKLLSYNVNILQKFENDHWKVALYPHLQFLLQWLPIKTDISTLNKDDLDYILPSLIQTTPHTQTFSWTLDYKDDLLNANVSFGYKAHDHGITLKCKLPFSKPGILGMLNFMVTFTFENNPILKNNVEGSLTLHQPGRILDHLTLISNRFIERTKDMSLKSKLKTIRVFSDYWLQRVAFTKENGDIELPFVFNIQTYTFNIGNGRSYDDLIAKFLPDFINQHSCLPGHKCEGH